MLELIFVNLFLVIKTFLTFGLLIGWIPAWIAYSKGAGKQLWYFYVISALLCLLMTFLGNPAIYIGPSGYDTFVSDWSIYAILNGFLGEGQRGMSFGAARFIARWSGIQIISLVYIIVVVAFWEYKRTDRREKGTFPIIGVAAIGLGLLSFSPFPGYFTSLFILPSIVCTVIAFRKDQKRLVSISIPLAIVGVLFLLP